DQFDLQWISLRPAKRWLAPKQEGKTAPPHQTDSGRVKKCDSRPLTRRQWHKSEMVAKLAGIYRRRITAASSQEIARYISEDTMARMVIPVITMFILKICAPYWMR